MPYLTKSLVQALARSRVATSRVAFASTVLKEQARASSTHHPYDIFLSHAHEDADIVLGVLEALTILGYSVYVDWVVDQHLDRSKVTPEHADLLRKRLKQSRFLLYTTTANSASSTWMPWELGYFDGHKPGKVAILPILDERASFHGQEFLGLYPAVEYGELLGDGSPDLYWRPLGLMPKLLRESIRSGS